MKNILWPLLARLLFGHADFGFLIYSGLVFEQKKHSKKNNNCVPKSTTRKDTIQSEEEVQTNTPI